MGQGAGRAAPTWTLRYREKTEVGTLSRCPPYVCLVGVAADAFAAWCRYSGGGGSVGSTGGGCFLAHPGGMVLPPHPGLPSSGPLLHPGGVPPSPHPVRFPGELKPGGLAPSEVGGPPPPPLPLFCANPADGVNAIAVNAIAATVRTAMIVRVIRHLPWSLVP